MENLTTEYLPYITEIGLRECHFYSHCRMVLGKLDKKPRYKFQPC